MRAEAINNISYKGTVSVEVQTHGNTTKKVIKNRGTKDLFYILCGFLGGINFGDGEGKIRTGTPGFLDAVWVSTLTGQERNYLTHHIGLATVNPIVMSKIEDGEGPFVEFNFNINYTDISPVGAIDDTYVPKLKLLSKDSSHTELASIIGDHELGLVFEGIGQGSKMIITWRMEFTSQGDN